MTESLKQPKSLVTQIIDETLDNLKTCPEFDQTIIDDLMRLAENGNLKKPQLVAQSLKVTSQKNENFRS